MKYCSIDIEATGLNPEKHSILSIGVIIEDTEKKLPYEDLPKFNAIILNNEIVGSPRAIAMNKEIIELMGDYLEGDKEMRRNISNDSGYSFYEKEDVAKHFFNFLFLNGYEYDITNGCIEVRTVKGRSLPVFGARIKPITINVAGKNFATSDKLYLEQLPWWKKLIRTRQRVIDPSILFCDWKNDESLPNLIDCKERGNIEGIVTHNALEDAWDIVQLLRKNY